MPGREGALVNKGERAIAIFNQLSQSEAQQDALLYPDVYLPVPADFFCGPDSALGKRLTKLLKDLPRLLGGLTAQRSEERRVGKECRSTRRQGLCKDRE